MGQKYMNYIDGQWQAAAEGATITDINPANIDEAVGVFALASRTDTAHAVEAAEKASPAWARLPMPKRGQILARAANLLEARAEEVATGLTREEGKTLAESKFEVERAVDILRYYAGETMQPTGEVYPSTTGKTFLYTERVPLGVVGLITPWNFPIAIPMWKIASALAFGNTVVFKPAILTPLTAWHIADVLDKADLPPGVFNLVIGKGSEAGQELVENPRVKAISFTGSNEVGARILSHASARGAKVQLEMGGKNAILVLPDVDLEKAVELTLAGAMLATGQKCTSTSRAIVDRELAAEFRDRLAARVETLRVGNGMKPETYMGPLVSADAEQKVLSYIEIGKAEGARLVVGGSKLRGEEYDRGYFVAPTVFDRVTPHMRIAQEEIFGPVVGLIEVRDFDEALRVANNTRFGLSISLVTRDLGLAMRFAREVEAGVVRVNSQTSGAELHVPFGGFKDSGHGSREQGKAAREFFTQVKTVYVDPP